MPDIEQGDLFRFAQQAVQEAPDCRESRIAEARQRLDDGQLTPNAEVLASRMIADPLHQIHYDL